MSENIVSTIGQHVFKYLPPEYTEKGAPFQAKKKVIERDGKKLTQYQFLGDGYYFWDYNIQRAHAWGHSHYKGNYKILEVPMTLGGDNFFDLAGSRQDLRILILAMKKVESHIRIAKLGAFLYGMQKIREKAPDKWPYSIIRAMNMKTNSNRIQFNHINGSSFITDPEIIICFYDKKEIPLHESRIIDKQ